MVFTSLNRAVSLYHRRILLDNVWYCSFTVPSKSRRRIAGSLNVNVLDEQFAAMADSLLDKNQPVALYCRSGKRSKKAAEILGKAGYQVYELASGFNGWQQAGQPVER